MEAVLRGGGVLQVLAHTSAVLKAVGNLCQKPLYLTLIPVNLVEEEYFQISFIIRIWGLVIENVHHPHFWFMLEVLWNDVIASVAHVTGCIFHDSKNVIKFALSSIVFCLTFKLNLGVIKFQHLPLDRGFLAFNTVWQWEHFFCVCSNS